MIRSKVEHYINKYNSSETSDGIYYRPSFYHIALSDFVSVNAHDLSILGPRVVFSKHENLLMHNFKVKKAQSDTTYFRGLKDPVEVLDVSYTNATKSSYSLEHIIKLRPRLFVAEYMDNFGFCNEAIPKGYLDRLEELYVGGSRIKCSLDEVIRSGQNFYCIDMSYIEAKESNVVGFIDSCNSIDTMVYVGNYLDGDILTALVSKSRVLDVSNCKSLAQTLIHLKKQPSRVEKLIARGCNFSNSELDYIVNHRAFNKLKSLDICGCRGVDNIERVSDVMKDAGIDFVYEYGSYADIELEF
jgi:hypothetical protein